MSALIAVKNWLLEQLARLRAWRAELSAVPTEAEEAEEILRRLYEDKQ